MRKVAQDAIDGVVRMMERQGKILCPECSSDNFKIYHAPGKHQPNAARDAAAAVDGQNSDFAAQKGQAENE